MMRLLTLIVVLMLEITGGGYIHAQFLRLRKRSQAERATRDLEKRQREVSQGNMFNPLQPMGARENFQRDDHIWSAETAYITTVNAGNLSITTPSRIGIHRNNELQSLLGAAFWVPNLMLKHRIRSDNWWIASRHGIYSSTPGLEWAKQNKHQSIADSLVKVPHIFTIRNELIISKPWDNDYTCVNQQPYLILTAALALDYGFPIGSNDLIDIDEHLGGSRNPALTGKGLLMNARLRADAQLTYRTFIEGGVKFFFHNFETLNAVEHHAALNYFLNHNTSISPGYILSFVNSGSSKVKIFPSIDLTWYFGEKPRRPRGLFEQQMF